MSHDMPHCQLHYAFGCIDFRHMIDSAAYAERLDDDIDK